MSKQMTCGRGSRCPSPDCWVEASLYRGWNTILAGSGVEALKKLEDYLPNVILTDMRMPAMNGIELVQILKGHPVYRNIPILAVGGASSRQVRQRVPYGRL